MAKFNLTTQESTVAQPDRGALLEDLADQLDLVDSTSGVPQDIQPETTAAPQEQVTTEQAPTVEDTSPDELAELRDKNNQRAYSLQDNYGTPSQNLGDVDIINILGPDRGNEVINGLESLSHMDTVMLPFKEEGKQEALLQLGVPREPKVLEEGVVDTDNYLDKGKTLPLTQAEMFHKLGAYEVVPDGRGLSVTKDFNTLVSVVAESHFAKEAAAQQTTSSDLVEAVGSKEAAELTDVSEEELPSGVKAGTLGAAIYDGWTMFKQRRDEGPEAELDKHLDDSQRMTKEAEELLGSYAKLVYSNVSPGIVARQPVTLQNGMQSIDYTLTPNGIKILTERNQHLMEPQLYPREQYTTSPESSLKYMKQKDSTGKHVEDRTTAANSVEEQARSYFASVMSAIPTTRKKLAFLGLGAAITHASRASQDPETGNITVGGVMGNTFNMGQKVADKVNNMSSNTILEARGLEQELTEIMQSGRGTDRINDLEKRISGMRAFAAESGTPEWKMKEFRRKATQALGIMQNVAEASDASFSFTNYVQKGTSRTGLSPQKLNPQNYKIVRQLVGDPTLYIVQPNSNSTVERAMLKTLGSHFFPEPNLSPDKILKDMRARVQMKDDKIIRIASVGRSIKALLAGYEAQPSIEAALNLNLNKETGQVTGVQALNAQVADSLVSLRSDEKVGQFMEVAFRDHPDEAINMIEQAIDLANYMDSLESGKPFQSAMNPIEVDGIANGFAALSMQVGSYSMAHRTGVMSNNPDRILADFTDENGVYQEESSPRAAVAASMRNSLVDLVDDKDFGIGIVEGSVPDYDSVNKFLTLAIKNEKEFLKPPVMTLPYGQAIESMGPQMLRTVTTDPILLERASQSEWGELGVAKMLHKILAHNLAVTLGPSVGDFSKAMKSLTVASMAADEPIVYNKATGTQTSVNSVDYVPTGGPTVEAKIGTLSTAKDGSPRRNEGVNRLKVHPQKIHLGALGIKAGGGSAVRLGILPQGILGFDGSVISLTFTGSGLSRIQAKTGQVKPYVIPIYDAVKTSLASFEAITEEINSVWKKTTVDYDLLGELHAGAVEAHKKGHNKLNALAVKNPNGLADAKHAAHLSDAITKSNKVNAAAFDSYQGIMDDANARLATAEADYGSDASFKLRSAFDMITNAQLFEMFKIDSPTSKLALSEAKVVADRIKSDREALGKAIGPAPSNQYYADVPKNFNF